MGVAWKAFKVFLMVLGSLAFAVLLAIVVYNLVTWVMFLSRLEDCDSEIGKKMCSRLEAQRVILKAEGFDFEPVSKEHEIGLIDYLTVDASGRPVFEHVFVYFAPEVSVFNLGDRTQSKQEVIERHTKAFASSAKDYACNDKDEADFEFFSSLRQPVVRLQQMFGLNNYREFMAAGGVLSFKIGITNDDHISSYDFSRGAIARAEKSGKSVSELTARAKEVGEGLTLEPFHFATDPIIITSCEDKP